MKRSRLFISTTSSNVRNLAIKYNLGIEIAEFCTAYNMDIYYKETKAKVDEEIKGIINLTIHAPFNELCVAAIDPKVKELTKDRYLQLINIAKEYNIKKVVIHTGYIPKIYFKEYFVKQAINFYKDFLNIIDKDITICLENVLEEDISLILDIVKGVNNDRLGICLDIGHAHYSSNIDVLTWLRDGYKYIKHFHIHDNDKSWDLHMPLGQGTIDLDTFFKESHKLVPDATYTIENMDAEDSIKYLINNNLLED